MTIQKKLIKIANQFPKFSLEEIFILFLTKNLPFQLKNFDLNCGTLELDESKIQTSLHFLNNIFKIQLFKISTSYSISQIFKVIPSIKIEDYHLLAEEIFDNLICLPNKNKTGTFYTPENVASLVVKETIKFPLRSGEKIVDPACGAGIFLRMSLREFQGDIFQKLDFIKKSLFGFDLNPKALELCKFLLLIEALTVAKDLELLDLEKLIPDLSNNFFCINTLTSKIDSKFDYVFCNPPFGLSRNQQIESNELAELKSLYQNFFPGKLNKYLIFTLKCYQFLKENGRAAVLTPNSWLGIRDGRSLRKYLIKEEAFNSILHFEKKVFSKLGVETNINILTKSLNKKITLKKYNSKLECTKISYLDNLLIKESEDCLINILWEDRFISIFNQIKLISEPLKNLSTTINPSIALQVYSLGKGQPPQSKEIVKNNSFHYDLKKNDHCFPYLDGKNLQAYQINWTGRYLEYGAWVAEFQDLKRYQTPRLILREVIGKVPYLVSVAYTKDLYLYNRSILHIHSDNIQLLKLLLVILNSKLSSFYFLIKGRKTNRKLFPKIVLDDLKYFPVPKNFDYDLNYLNKLLINPTNPVNRSLLDKLVYKQYSLAEEQISIIEETLQEWKTTF